MSRRVVGYQPRFHSICDRLASVGWEPWFAVPRPARYGRPVEIPVESGRRLWLRWVAANALGLGTGMALFGVLDDTVGELGDTGDAIAHLGGLPLAATVFGLCQWLILRRYARRSGWGIVGAA
jgi:hypothetical protein